MRFKLKLHLTILLDSEVTGLTGSVVVEVVLDLVVVMVFNKIVTLEIVLGL